MTYIIGFPSFHKLIYEKPNTLIKLLLIAK